MPTDYDNIDEGRPESILDKYTYKQLDSITGVVTSFKEVMRKVAAEDPHMRQYMPLSMQAKVGSKKTS